MSEAEVLRLFGRRMSDIGLTGVAPLSFALQTVLQLLEIHGRDGGVPPFLATLAGAVAPFTAPPAQPSPSPSTPPPARELQSCTTPARDPTKRGSEPDTAVPQAPADVNGGGNVFGACPTSPHFVVSWLWHVLDLHAAGAPARAQALAVVLHLLHQKVYLAALGYTLEPYYGPHHPTCQGPLTRLPSLGSQGSSTPDIAESEGHFMGEDDPEEAPGEAKAEAPPRPETKPAPPTAALKAFGSTLQGKMKGLFKAAGA